MRPTTLFAVATMFWSPAVMAQDLNMGGISNSWSSTQMLLNSEKEAWAAPECTKDGEWATECGDAPPRAVRPRDRATPRAAAPAAPAAAPADLGFTPSPALRKRNIAAFMANMEATNPVAAAEIQAQLGGRDLIELIGGEIARYGLKTDNLPDAMAIFVMESWEAMSGRVLPPSRPRGLAVRRQMAEAAATLPALSGATGAARQELAESMLLQAFLISSTAQANRQAGAGPAETQAMADTVVEIARATLGIDLRTMTLTDDGLVQTPAR